jgi:hypothetical protein
MAVVRELHRVISWRDLSIHAVQAEVQIAFLRDFHLTELPVNSE